MTGFAQMKILKEEDMTQSKHTPGPWKILDEGHEDDDVVITIRAAIKKARGEA